MFLSNNIEKKQNDNFSISNIAATLSCFRKHFSHRIYFVAQNIESLLKQINNWKTNSIKCPLTKPQIVFIFSGQGANYKVSYIFIFFKKKYSKFDFKK